MDAQIELALLKGALAGFGEATETLALVSVGLLFCVLVVCVAFTIKKWKR